ncbi:MAG: P-II family nitrogen regulator [Mollicutes bacterium]|jgi:nitrogen regulatory protein PII|nr:P-II family nitrogen regulator [Mollicutes bacterium]
MENNNTNSLNNYKLIITIVKKGRATNLIAKLKKIGLEGNTIMFGKGAAEKRIYEQILGIKYEPEKEIILMVVEDSKVNKIVNKITELEQLNKPGHGIALVLDLKKCIGISKLLNKKGDN